MFLHRWTIHFCCIGGTASLKARSFLVSEVRGGPDTVLLMEMLRRGSEKRGHCSHRSPFLSLKLCLPLNLIRFWYQAFSSYASLPLQHAWNCTALSIIYSLSFAYCFLWMPSLGHLQLCCLWYDALLHLPHRSDPPPQQVWAQLICWRWLGSYGFFSPFHPMTARWGAMRAGC